MYWVISMATKCRVLHVLQSSKFSGAENVVCRIIEMFENTEIEMAYCSRNGQIGEVLKKRNITFFPMTTMSVSEIKRIVKLYKPDIVHAHDYMASILCAMSVKCRIISHLHNNSPWIKDYSLKSFLYLISCFRYGRILAVSDAILDEYVFGSLIRKKTLVMGNPIDVAEIKNKAVQSSPYPEKYDVIFLGRLVPAKKPLRFIKIIKELYKSLPDLKVVMVGNGELLEECQKSIYESGLTDVIRLLGFMANPYPALLNSKILCMTSEWEGYGLVAAEALTLGLPVVCTRAGGLKQIVNDECGKFCDDDAEFCDELKRLLTDDKYISLKSRKAVLQSELLNNIKSYRESLTKIYFELYAKENKNEK